MSNLEWLDLAACRGMDPEKFFTSVRGRGAHREVREAYETCARCPVIKRCGEHATATNSGDGVWGGQLRRRYA